MNNYSEIFDYIFTENDEGQEVKSVDIFSVFSGEDKTADIPIIRYSISLSSTSEKYKSRSILKVIESEY